MTKTLAPLVGAVIVACLLVTFGGSEKAGAVGDSHVNHRERGRTLAVQLCAECHVVGGQPHAGGFVGPSFVGIANMPSTTGTALTVFLQSHHQRMPSLRLDRNEADAVIDDILSLKEAPP
ncbi:hypothetical protein ASG52_04350 [Methylobacterium sp. Leaf456]|uniref:hypothetical protein n=1 Tax=Methylobacterium sp. Leaf456 TaxID=1736382 RepID=UPI0006F28366|nr:hypothetical protein [Methylobacterium sp. Leaf456]KQT53362.1 hypothetical protein ASG52_04350 [Methylobacterium sp. Leaf456]